MLESIAIKLTDKTKERNTTYMYDKVKYVINTFGKRNSGSVGERSAQEYYARELKKYTDKVVIENFEVHPLSFLGWIPISMFSLLLGLIFYFFIPAIGLAFSLFALIPMYSQLIRFKQWFDPFFPKKTSCNVYGTKAPNGEIKRRIIFVGHTDAAWEFYWHYKFGFKGLITIGLVTLVSGVFLLGISIVRFATTVFEGIILTPELWSLPFILGACIVPFVIFWLMMLKFSNFKEVVDGANDNLSANMVAMAVVKAMQEDGFALENTEIGILFTGSEEIGIRGAKAFVNKHAKEMNDVPTAIVNLETLRDIKYLSILRRDINATIKNDHDIERLILKACENLSYDVSLDVVEVGATDAAAFSQAGMKATTLVAMAHQLENYYHTRRDTWDNMNPEVMSNVLDICIETTWLFDKNGFDVTTRT